MNKKIWSEIDFLRLIFRRPRHPDAIVGMGDDAAAYRSRRGVYVVTTDMLVEGDHFSLGYFSPREIGIKAMESNVSDIAAMGARPLFAFISLALKKGASARFVAELYQGIDESARRHKIDVMGGDTTHGAIMVVNVALVGFARRKEELVLRSGARPGDLIFVTGELGGSAAGLRLFQKRVAGFPSVKREHTQPRARLDVSGKIAKIATAMEDVSDGLASEVRNICLASGTGAVIFAEKIPILRLVRKAAQAVGEDALDFANFGGEDFELVFSVPARRRKEAEKLGTCVGEITRQKGKIYLEKGGKRKLLRKFGYDHFAQEGTSS
jgi:thiamine-monophosphate kinase